eukprot:6737986-Prymnesium_polylepis.1
MPATILHDGAMRCHTPRSDFLGDSAVEVSLNGLDFSSSAPPVAYHRYDNWIVPRVGGNAVTPCIARRFASRGGPASPSRWARPALVPTP